MKYGSFLVVTPSSIPSSATHGPNADLFFEGYEEVLEDSDDEPTVKKRIFDCNEEEGDEHKAETMGTYLSYLLSFSLHPLSLPSSSFYMYLRNLLMQSPFILYVFSSDHRDF